MCGKWFVVLKTLLEFDLLLDWHPILYSIVKNQETLCKAEREGRSQTNLKLGQVFSVSEDKNVHLAQGPTKDQVNVFVFCSYFFRLLLEIFYSNLSVCNSSSISYLSPTTVSEF